MRSTQSADHHDDWENEDSRNSTRVVVAFAEPIEDERYYFRSFLPSKIGGKPAWLNPRNLPSPADLQCKQCKKPLKFLLQMYCPLDDLADFEHCHHRTMYVFICGQPSCCGKAGSLKVFRCQLPIQNEFYEDWESQCTELETRDKEDILLEKLSAFECVRIEPYPDVHNCIVCGHLGSFKCGQCKNPLIHYCCKDHQRYHWRKQHREYCRKRKVLETEQQIMECLKDYPFPIFDIVPEPEPLPDPEHDALSMKMKRLKIKSNSEEEKGSKGGDDGYSDADLKLLEEQMARDFDDVYLRFQDRVQRAPAQVIRYADRANFGWSDGGDPDEVDAECKDGDGFDDEEEIGNSTGWDQPLWMGAQGMLDRKDVPECPKCGGERKFEFQVMPQLLSVLKQGVNDLDWGSLVVYSCPNSCGDGHEGYFEEFIHYQASYGAFEQRDGDGWIGLTAIQRSYIQSIDSR